MKYFSGADIRVGDVVSVKRNDGNSVGTVVLVVEPDSPDARQWNAKAGGVLIEGGGYGLSLTESLANDPEVELIRRAEK